MKIRENDYIVIQAPMVTELGLSGNKLIIFALIQGFCRDGEHEFHGSINYICEWTNLTRNTVMAVLRELVDEHILERRDYIVNNVKFCAYKLGSAIIAPPVQNQDEGSAKIAPNNIEDNSNSKNEIDESISKKSSELFEECWIAYRRKGSKKKGKEYWNKLTDVERQNVMLHIKAYVANRDLQYQKDFERYLRDRIFKTVVFNGNKVVYDPTKLGRGESAESVYMPTCDGALSWNDYYNCFMYVGFWDGRHIADGYTDETRPKGATITLNNGRGTITWNSDTKQWEKV